MQGHKIKRIGLNWTGLIDVEYMLGMTEDEKPKIVTDTTPKANLPHGTVRAAAAQTPTGIVTPIKAKAVAGAMPTSVQSVYASTAAAFPTVDEQTAVLSLEGKLVNLAPPVLYALAHDTEAVGPRIGVSNVPEPTLKALAAYEWERRETEKAKQEAKSARAWSLGEKILLVIVAAAVGALLTWAGLS